MKGKRRNRRAIKFTEEFLADRGIEFIHSMLIKYQKGWVGIRKTIRTGICGDDFVQNMRLAVIDIVRVPHILAPKSHRKNTISNRKTRRMRLNKQLLDNY